MPFKNHEIATTELKDSLYYSLSVSDGSELINGFPGTDFTEGYISERSGRLIDVKSGSNSLWIQDTFKIEDGDTVPYVNIMGNWGIDPAAIKVIKSDKYQNTLIATREFETRLQLIFKACKTSILEIYVKNLEKNLWELDSMAANAYSRSENEISRQFKDFSKQDLTNVRDVNKHAELLQGYYEKQLGAVKKQLEAIKEEAVKELEKQNKVAQKTADKYKDLLWKREKYRMEKYGFEMTETGWVNVDIGIQPKEWEMQYINVKVAGGKNYDAVYTYIVNTSIKSLFRMNTVDNEVFKMSQRSDRGLILPKTKTSIAVAIGYKGEASFIAIEEFIPATTDSIKLVLAEASITEIKRTLKPYNKYSKENKINKDLEYMAFFAKEKQRQKQLQEESAFILKLWWKVFPCGLVSDTPAFNRAMLAPPALPIGEQ
jgi:hypothetical protein